MTAEQGLHRIVVDLGFVEFPVRYTCDGEDISPGIIITGLSAPSVALIMHNPYERGCSFSPWIAWNIEPLRYSDGRAVIPEGIPKEKVVEAPAYMVQGTNGYGRIGYQGPCPPRGEAHRYYVRVYGLDTSLDLPPGSDQHALVAAMQGHGLEYGETFAMYRRA